MSLQKRKEQTAWLSVASNSCLVILKVIAGLAIGSVSILSEAIHSSMDLLASLIALFSVKTSSRPADAGHPFGHGKVESISGLIEAVLIFIAAFWIIYEAFKKIASPEGVTAPGWGVAVMLFSALMNYLVSRRLFAVGKEADSIALVADAWHLRTDVYTSLGVMAGLAMIWLGGLIVDDPRLHWLDPAAALIVAVFIIKAAFELTVKAAGDLMDAGLPQDENTWFRDVIAARRDEIHGFHQLRPRKAVHFRFVEFRIKVEPSMSVEASHAIASDLKREMLTKYPHATVTIHVEPCDGRCTRQCIDGCLLPPEKRPDGSRP